MVAAKVNSYKSSNQTKLYPSKNLFEIHDILGKVMTYVDEDDHFRMRGLNRMFQSFYYNQTVVYNHGRALFMSKKGRQFHRVTELKVDLDTFSGSKIKHINPHTFPRLIRVSIPRLGQKVSNEDLKCLNHPGIRGLKVDLCQAADVATITEAKFPELRKLWVSIRGFINVRSYKPMRLFPHTKLEEIIIDYIFLDDSFLYTLTAENFPNLRKLKICEDSCFLIKVNVDEVKEIMQRQGIILELLQNAGGIGI